ncbi:hypothetical protein DMA12_30515 [Amycolatopsis balhimycina DSM 5908]|jgi:hypothetical protein|uniref:Uncharacterized protein n=1 Tax=Amycolatopsis balhimycina DSM 5908 TaxID=1081091 RepID=A0A428W7V0_AMYBA|nr:hypothetical protein [Amycolatopsis balhimycina]RSM39160.1 hypothetical protein DMA12_30515 [Amycolatopsis balhimycina DSM 5908]
MSGSVEVRQFLLRYEGADGGSAPFAGALPAQRSGAADTQRVSDDQVRRARLAVANGALGVEDCVQLLEMLGLNLDEDGQAPVQR